VVDEIDGGMLLRCNVLASSVQVRMEGWGKLRREGVKMPVSMICIVCDVKFVCLSLSVGRFRRSLMGEFWILAAEARRDDWGREVQGVEVIGRGLTESERIGN